MKTITRAMHKLEQQRKRPSRKIRPLSTATRKAMCRIVEADDILDQQERRHEQRAN